MIVKHLLEYPKISSNCPIDFFANEDDEITISEKIDGANFRFVVTHDNEIIFGSREHLLSPDNQRFKPAMDYVTARMKHVPIDYRGCVFFGEATIPHQLQYTKDIPPFLGFDVYSPMMARFLDCPRINFEYFDIYSVPTTVQKAGQIKNITTENMVSNYGNFQPEGLVFKNYRTQEFWKHVRPDFCEKKKFRDTFIATHLTTARVIKSIHKLQDDGHQLEPDLIKALVAYVAKDIKVESKTGVPLQQIEKAIGGFCFKTLKTMLENQ